MATFKVSNGSKSGEVEYPAPRSLEDDRWAKHVAGNKSQRAAAINELARQALVVKYQNSGAREKFKTGGLKAAQKWADGYRYSHNGATAATVSAEEANLSEEQQAILRAAGVNIED